MSQLMLDEYDRDTEIQSAPHIKDLVKRSRLQGRRLARYEKLWENRSPCYRVRLQQYLKMVMGR